MIEVSSDLRVCYIQHSAAALLAVWHLLFSSGISSRALRGCMCPKQARPASPPCRCCCTGARFRSHTSIMYYLEMGGGAPSLSVTARPEAGAAATLQYGSTAPNKNTGWQVHHCCCCCWCCCSLKPCQLAAVTTPTSRPCSHTHGLCRYE
jgi:hypothetical protein